MLTIGENGVRKLTPPIHEGTLHLHAFIGSQHSEASATASAEASATSVQAEER